MKKYVVSSTLKDNNKIVKIPNEVDNIFNDYYAKIVSLLQIPEWNNIDQPYERMSCPTLKSIMKYRRHPIITAIQDPYKGSSFSFSTAKKVDFIRESKSSAKRRRFRMMIFLSKYWKNFIENFFTEYICIFYNYAITTPKFPSFLKMENITLIFKKGSKSKMENYRPVNILPVLLKIFKKLTTKQLSTFFENILSKFECGFRKVYSTQHCLLLMLEKW